MNSDVDDMCYDRRRAEDCEDESAHHALANAGGREIVGKTRGVGRLWERRRVLQFDHPLVDLLQSCSRGGEEERGGHVL